MMSQSEKYHSLSFSRLKFIFKQIIMNLRKSVISAGNKIPRRRISAPIFVLKRNPLSTQGYDTHSAHHRLLPVQ